MSEAEIRQRVRQFYDRVGWQMVEGGSYQNARYEDQRPVSREYIHRCHLRVKRFLKPNGRFLLDAGSGPVQYADYLTYSEGYQRRVCVDISIVALKEARQRVGDHGLYVVADVANLPFKAEPFEGIVSLHTFHHLPLAQQAQAYDELYRVLQTGCTAVVVNGWTDSPLMRRFGWLVHGMERAGALIARMRQGKKPAQKDQPGRVARRGGGERNTSSRLTDAAARADVPVRKSPSGTFINKLDPAWLRQNIGAKMRYELYPWRSVSVRFLRAVVHSAAGGKLWLSLLFWLEERFPRFFAGKGQYPMVIIRK